MPSTTETPDTAAGFDTATTNSAATAARLRLAVALLLRRTRHHEPAPQLSLTKLSILGRLSRSRTMTATELAGAESLRPQTVRNLIDELREDGLIVGVRDTADARRVNLMLTPQGQALAHGHAGPRHHFLVRALDDLTATERLRLTDAIEILERIAYQ